MDGSGGLGMELCNRLFSAKLPAEVSGFTVLEATNSKRFLLCTTVVDKNYGICQHESGNFAKAIAEFYRIFTEF